MAFTLQHLHSVLKNTPDCERYVVALSGGMDSVCLAHGLSQLKSQGKIEQELHALHINHGLSDSADQWQQFCADFCAAQDLPLTIQAVEVTREGSLEAAARASRYQAFADFLVEGDVLLLAHHLDDQLETFLLRLLRGAGVTALAGMPDSRAVGVGQLFRPLLNITRQDVEDYARSAALSWIEDDSNADLQHDRNYLRHEVLPAVAQRWANYQEPWRKSLLLLEESATVLAEVAESDLRAAAKGPNELALSTLSQLSEARLRMVLRLWIKQAGFAEPGWHSLQAISPASLASSNDRVLLETSAYRLQEFDGLLYLLQTQPELESLLPINVNLSGSADISLPNNGVLKIFRESGVGLSDRFSQAAIRFRDGGEQLKLFGRPTKSLKKLLQEHRIQPWIRERIPLVFVDDELIYVPGIGVAESAQAQPGEAGIVLEWCAPELGVALR